MFKSEKQVVPPEVKHEDNRGANKFSLPKSMNFGVFVTDT